MDVRMHRMTKTLACWRARLRVTRTFRNCACGVRVCAVGAASATLVVFRQRVSVSEWVSARK